MLLNLIDFITVQNGSFRDSADDHNPGYSNKGCRI